MSTTTAPAELFAQLSRLLPEPLLLVKLDGRVVGSSPAARALFGLQDPEFQGRSLAELVEEGLERVSGFLRLCARTTDPLPGSFTLKLASGDRMRRSCHGARLSLGDEPHGPLVFLRFSADVRGSTAFGLLGQKIDELTREVSRRHLAETALRASGARLRRIVDSNIVGIFFWNQAGGIDYANDAFLQMLGYRREELESGQLNWRRLVSPEDAGTGEGLMELLQRTGRPPPHEKLFQHREGHWVPILTAAATFLDMPEEGVAFALDLTERKKAEENLRLLVEASTALGSSLDFAGMMAALARVMVPRFADWCGVFMQEAEQPIRLLAIHHIDSNAARAIRRAAECYLPVLDAPHGVGRVLRTGRGELLPLVTDDILGSVARDAEHLMLLREASPCSGIVLPITLEGRVSGALLLLSLDSRRAYGTQDLLVAEEVVRRASTALENARLFEAAKVERRRAEEANRLKDDFLSTVSHELRTPLTSMLGWLQMLRNGSLRPEKQAKALETIERNARHQTQLVEDLLDVSRILVGKMRLAMEPLVLSEVVGAAVEGVRPMAEAKGVRLLQMLDTSVGLMRGDATRLQQVVSNLLQNAVKFTPEGGRVEVILQREGSHAVITVVDTGQGIAPGFLPHLFQRFRQADASTTRQHGGLGLGLAIVKHLVEMHGGGIAARSEGQGKGATFTVRLPLMVSSLESAPGEPAKLASADLQALGCPPSLSGQHVLLVDDEADTREMLKDLLEGCGMRVSLAASAAEGLEVLKHARPDVLVSDIGMPEADGYTFIQQIRKLPPEGGGRTPAVALTAYARGEDRRRALMAGFTMHVPKPIEPMELLLILANVGGPPEPR